MRIQSMVLAFGVAALAASCATTSTRNLYSGPERPPEEVASVIVPWQVQVRNVSGQKVSMSLFGGSEREMTFRVLPGVQEWNVRYYDPFADDRKDRNTHVVDQTGIVSLRFKAEAGHVYRLNFETPEQNPALRNAKHQVMFSVAEEAGGMKTIAVEQDIGETPVKRRPPESDHGGRTSMSAPQPVALEQATLDQLKSWWRVAAPAERKAFLEWVDEERQP